MADTPTAALVEAYWGELDALRAKLAAFCDAQGYKDRPNPAARVIDLAAAFIWLEQAQDDS